MSKENDVVKQEENILDHIDQWEESPAERKRLLRKMDYNLIPVLAVAYFFSGLDRNNIGNNNLETPSCH